MAVRDAGIVHDDHRLLAGIVDPHHGDGVVWIVGSEHLAVAAVPDLVGVNRHNDAAAVLQAVGQIFQIPARAVFRFGAQVIEDLVDILHRGAAVVPAVLLGDLDHSFGSTSSPVMASYAITCA